MSKTKQTTTITTQPSHIQKPSDAHMYDDELFENYVPPVRYIGLKSDAEKNLHGFSHYCALCSFGAFSDKVFDIHRGTAEHTHYSQNTGCL